MFQVMVGAQAFFPGKYDTSDGIQKKREGGEKGSFF
jgi:hypothetical protein